MKYTLLAFFLFTSVVFVQAQTKVSGRVTDSLGNPMAYVYIIFNNSTEGTTTNGEGEFYLESEQNYDALEVSFMGFETKLIPLKKGENLQLDIVLKHTPNQLSSVTIFSGKTPKKNNPAIAILKKIWKNKRSNGVHQYKQYQYHKYEKLEFDLNNIDSSMRKSPLFKGMRFVFNYTDTSSITGQSYLPIFINEAYYQVYGDNTINIEKEILIGNQNSGFNSNHALIAFINDLYAEYNVYDNYLKFFEKSFVSPLSQTGIDVYNYVLADSSFIDNKWCYRIVYYPRRDNDLTFKGDFWVNDTTWAIKKIDLTMTDGANINWVNGVHIEQEFDVLNDSTFVITKDHFMANFALRKSKDVHGVYGKRTTYYNDYTFNSKKPKDFYKERRVPMYRNAYQRDTAFWQKHRMAQLNGNERDIYKMLDTLETTFAFKRLYSIGSIMASGYINFDNFDYGPVLSTFGYNDVEGLRLRVGGRTYFSQNDMWRVEGYGAYGFKDHKFKYGISAKWLLDPKLRLKVMAGRRSDIEQLGASLTNSTNVLDRNFASSSLITVGSNETLSHLELTTAAIEFSPFKSFRVRFGAAYREISPASPEFNLDYHPSTTSTKTASTVHQTTLSTTLFYTPGRETTGYGVERITVNRGDFAKLYLKYTLGVKGILGSDFDYKKLQFFYLQPLQIGGIGRLTTTLELGKTFGGVPLALLSAVPGNQTLFSTFGTFPLLNYYEFVTDSYASLHLEHNFNGRLFAYIPILRDWNLREIIGFRAVTGSLSDDTKALNASTSHPALMAPNEHVYWGWSVGVGNIFKMFRIDFHFRGNYLNHKDARQFGVTVGFGLHF